jgi:hypothetical protein
MMNKFQKTLVLLWVFNLWDAVATWYAVVVARFAYEVNPLMAAAIKSGPLTFFGIKLGTTTVLAVYLWDYWGKTRQKTKKARSVWYPLCAVTVLYVLLGIWHVAMFAVQYLGK